MTRIREEIAIAAPAERVWQVVHEDLDNARRWTAHLKRASVVAEDESRRVLRYEIELPAWKGALQLEEDLWEPPRRCAGRFTGGPLKGTWSYLYRERSGRTRLVYEMDYELGGLLRVLGGVLAGQYAAGIRETLASLKAYVEAGSGPGAARDRAR